ncbi:hypothetical protein BU16DRAFT_52692 [Lophium mytilinum]|uniref:DUF7730 domain-containing protein n=1 Tax=Lophium mytilinum TaxID=390894 RepID=A0A6A6QPS8_9PEZI|nr:hypothetical protein BU16DRAFT_52692 [Lophium mytilinum]
MPRGLLTTHDVKERDRATLMTLPVELRLQIYNHLLISRFDRSEHPSWAVGATTRKLVSLDMPQAPQYRTMEPSILQTCKQIYREANPVLYSQNVFKISEPEQMFQLSAQIGPVNLKLMKRLKIIVPWTAELVPWLQLLDMLAMQASGLRHVELAWGAENEYPWAHDRKRGLGDSLDFLRALGNVQGLKKLVIKGCYAKNWPVYLKERMGGQVVQAICGDCRDEPESGVWDLNDDELQDDELMLEYDDRDLKKFEKYQQGTEDLMP